MDREPEVTIVVLNWNGYNDTSECINSLQNLKYDNYSIVVVDNDSRQDELTQLKAEFGDDIVALQNQRNLGFGAGNNTGISWALDNGNPEYVLTLNNDTTVEDDFLTALIDGVQSHTGDRQIAAAGPVVRDRNRPSTVWSAGTNNESFLQPTQVRHRNTPASQLPDDPFVTDGVVGCAVLYTVDCLHRIGFIDEDYFLGYEEHDWCQRAADAGYEFLIVPDAVVYHGISNSRGRDNPLYEYYAKRNRLLFYHKNYTGIKRVTAIVLFTVRFLLESLSTRLTDRAKGNAALSGILDGLAMQPPRKIP